MSKIHPLAVVSPDAVLGHDVEVGPFSVIEAGTEVGDGCTLASHVVVKSGTRLGPGNQVFEGAVIGGPPQHVKAGGEHGWVEIGSHNVIRENVTIHRAFDPSKTTTIGSHNFLMCGVHIAHDCCLGNHIIMANNATLAGHVTVGDRAFLSGQVAVHQFCRIGRLAMVGGLARVTQDVPPFVMVDGATYAVVGLNVVGLKRNGFATEDIRHLKAAYRLIFRSGLRWVEMLAQLATEFPTGPAAEFHPFLMGGTRGIVHERRAPKAATVRLGEDARPNADEGDDPKFRVCAG